MSTCFYKIGYIEGCAKCLQSGVKGRRAIHELLVITRNIKEAILENASDLEIGRIAAEKDGFQSMQAAGRKMIAEGMITVEEFKRILMVDD